MNRIDIPTPLKGRAPEESTPEADVIRHVGLGRESVAAPSHLITAPPIPSVESLIRAQEDKLFALSKVTDLLRIELNRLEDEKRDILRKLTNLRMARIAAEKEGM